CSRRSLASQTAPYKFCIRKNTVASNESESLNAAMRRPQSRNDKSMKTNPDSQSTLDPTYWLDHHGDFLYRYALMRVRDAAVAEDMLQETLLAAMSAYQAHEGRSSERTWLVGIMRHKIVDHFRRLARTPEFQMSSDEGSADVNSFEQTGAWRGHWREDQAPVSWPVNAAALLESKEFWETLERCLSCLSP